ncbi:hypothetical protein HKX48_002408 [Thoreauomyces humboldtii]|nr:hypothetical protein HKX48_002408 [Thoreauomyces humboldtii]
MEQGEDWDVGVPSWAEHRSAGEVVLYSRLMEGFTMLCLALASVLLVNLLQHAVLPNAYGQPLTHAFLALAGFLVSVTGSSMVGAGIHHCLTVIALTRGADCYIMATNYQTRNPLILIPRALKCTLRNARIQWTPATSSATAGSCTKPTYQAIRLQYLRAALFTASSQSPAIFKDDDGVGVVNAMLPISGSDIYVTSTGTLMRAKASYEETTESCTNATSVATSANYGTAPLFCDSNYLTTTNGAQVWFKVALPQKYCEACTSSGLYTYLSITADLHYYAGNIKVLFPDTISGASRPTFVDFDSLTVGVDASLASNIETVFSITSAVMLSGMQQAKPLPMFASVLDDAGQYLAAPAEEDVARGILAVLQTIMLSYTSSVDASCDIATVSTYGHAVIAQWVVLTVDYASGIMAATVILFLWESRSSVKKVQPHAYVRGLSIMRDPLRFMVSMRDCSAFWGRCQGGCDANGDLLRMASAGLVCRYGEEASTKHLERTACLSPSPSNTKVAASVTNTVAAAAALRKSAGVQELLGIRERELRDIYAALEQRNLEKEAHCHSLEERLKALQDDFFYNIGLLEDRDRELERYDSMTEGLTTDIHDREAKISDLKVLLNEKTSELANFRSLLCSQEQQHHDEIHKMQREKEAEQQHVEDKFVALTEEHELEQSDLKLQIKRVLQEKQIEREIQSVEMDQLKRSHEAALRSMKQEHGHLLVAADHAVSCATTELQTVKLAKDGLEAKYQAELRANEALDKKLQQLEWKMLDTQKASANQIVELEETLRKTEQAAEDARKLFEQAQSKLNLEYEESKKTLLHGTAVEANKAVVLAQHLAAASEQLALQQTENTKTVSGLQAQLLEKDEEVRRLQSNTSTERSEVNRFVQQHRQELMQRDDQITGQQEYISKLEQELAERCTDCESMQHEIGSLAARNQQLEQTIVQLNLEAERKVAVAYRKKNGEQTDVVRSLVAAKDAADAQVKDNTHLQTENARLIGIIQQMRHDMETMQNSIVPPTRAQFGQTSNHDFRQQLAPLHSRIADLESSLDQKQSIIDHLLQQQEKMYRQLDGRDVEGSGANAELWSENQGCRQRCAVLAADVQRMTRERATLLDMSNALKAEVRFWSDKMENREEVGTQRIAHIMLSEHPDTDEFLTLLEQQKASALASKAKTGLPLPAHMKKRRSVLEVLMATTIIGDAYAPCSKPVSELSPTTLSQLRLETHHRGKVLVVRTVVPSFRVQSVQTVVVDANDDAQMLAVYNLLDSIPTDVVLPHDTILAIKEPYFKLAAGEGALIRIDHPSDMVVLKDDDELVPSPLRKKRQIESASEYKDAGNLAFKRADYYTAATAYTDALDSASGKTSDLTYTLHRNRASVHLRLGRWELVLEDALAAVIVPPDDESSSEARSANSKAFFRAGRAEYELRAFGKAKEYFAQALKLAPGDKDCLAELRRSIARLIESEKGIYDFARMK